MVPLNMGHLAKPEMGEDMQYNTVVLLRNGAECRLRNGVEEDGRAVFDNFNATHAQSDYLLAYPDENRFDAAQEGEFLREKSENDREVELVALIDDVIVGTAGIESLGSQYKVRHRAEFGVSVDKAYWGLGVGSALLSACIKCAMLAGYKQLELNVVADNTRALALYSKNGFVEYGRNPRGFYSRISGFQELVYMRLDLDVVREAVCSTGD